MFDPKYFDSSSFEISTLDLKKITIDFQVIHGSQEVGKYLRECFAISFYNIISAYEYNDYLKEKVIEYLMQNDSEELYQTAISSIHDIDDEQVKDYILNVLIDDLGIFSNFVSLKSENKEDKYITQFTLNLSEFLTIFESIKELDENITDFINDFVLGIKNKLNARCIIKYKDSYVKQQYMHYYSEIYDLEMELRKILTYIFNNEYESPYALLNDYDLKIPKDNQKDEEYFSTNYENEFFMLCFSDYIKICNKQLKNIISNKDLIEIVKESSDFEEFKKKLPNGIQNIKYLDFLSSIKEDLNSLEEMRNSIMHSRKYSLDIESYERSKEQLSKKIENFWKDIIS